MPRDIPTFTNCAGPGVARSHKQLGGLAGLIITAWFQNKFVTAGAVFGFLAALLFTPLGNPATWTVTAVVLVAALLDVKYWYYNERLLCVAEEECAIGTVISNPSASFDGDRKLNLLLAPFDQAQCVQTLRDHVDTNEAMLLDASNFNEPAFHTSPPDLPSRAARNSSLPRLREYMAALRSKHPAEPDIDANMFNQIVIGVVDRLLSDPAKNFFNRFFRQDADHVSPGSDLDEAIPEDFDDSVAWQDPDAQSGRTQLNLYRDRFEGLNPMFRFSVNRDPDKPDGHLVPYLHCEIEGNRIALLIDDIILALLAFIATLIVLTAIFGPAGIIGALIAAIAVFLLKNIFDNLFRNDGNAEEPDIDFDDPDDLAGDPMSELAGDLVAVEGRWIMDAEHGQYFEIHPVRSYFLIARNVFGDEPVPVESEEEREELGHDKFDPTLIDADRAERICNFVRGIDDDSGPIVLKPAPEALSYGMRTFYGGGGFKAE